MQTPSEMEAFFREQDRRFAAFDEGWSASDDGSAASEDAEANGVANISAEPHSVPSKELNVPPYVMMSPKGLTQSSSPPAPDHSASVSSCKRKNSDGLPEEMSRAKKARTNDCLNEQESVRRVSDMSSQSTGATHLESHVSIAQESGSLPMAAARNTESKQAIQYDSGITTDIVPANPDLSKEECTKGSCDSISRVPTLAEGSATPPALDYGKSKISSLNTIGGENKLGANPDISSSPPRGRPSPSLAETSISDISSPEFSRMKTPVSVRAAAPHAADSSDITTPGNSFVAPSQALTKDKPEATARNAPVKPSAKSMRPHGLMPVPVVSNDLAGPSKLPQKTTTRAAPTKGKAKTKTNKKEKLPSMLPSEYAQLLMDRRAAAIEEGEEAPKNKRMYYLRGRNIIYCGGDMSTAVESTRDKLEFIAKNGGTLVPKYDPDIITHIVTDTSRIQTLRALGLKRLCDIPDRIPTVRWGWVVDEVQRRSDQLKSGKGNVEDVEDDPVKALKRVRLNAAFNERVPPDPTKHNQASEKGKSIAAADQQSFEDAHELSHISQFTSGDSSSDNEQSPPVPSHLLSPPATQLQHEIKQSSASLNGHQLQTGTNTSYATVRRRMLSDDDGEDEEPDPLAEFYADARAEKATELAFDLNVMQEEADQVGTSAGNKGTFPIKGWACNKQESRTLTKDCPNQDVIDKLEELRQLHAAGSSNDDVWKEKTLRNCISSIREYPERIASHSEAQKIRGVGVRTANKIMEIIQTGQLKRIHYQNSDAVKVTRLFQGVYGVGKTVAYQWFMSGCKSLEDVRTRKGGIRVNTVQQIGLDYYEDINSRMPRDEARQIFDMIRPIALEIDPGLTVEIMGSYRRGKGDCGDIDILISRSTDDGRTHAGVLRRLLRQLHDRKILTEDLHVPTDYDDLEAIYRGLCRRDKSSKRRRIDFLTVPWASRGAALLYYTGDDIFNRSMRLRANKMGYSLNQRGLYTGVIRNPLNWQEKLSDGNIIASETEEEIFKMLQIPWQEPHERNRG